jgi:hypothetical protein
MKQFIKDLPLIVVILVGFVADAYIRSSEAAQRFVGPKEFSSAIVKEWQLLFT